MAAGTAAAVLVAALPSAAQPSIAEPGSAIRAEDPAGDESPVAPSGTVPGDEAAPAAETGDPVAAPDFTTESWTPTSHAVTTGGETTVDLYAQPAFRRDQDGWAAIDATITPGTGQYPFEALGLSNPVHFGTSADALVILDTVDGSVVLGLPGATVSAPTLSDGVVRYAGVFPGVDLEFRTEGGRLGKHLILADEDSARAFTFTISDPGHTLGQPTEGDGESWEFDGLVGFGVGLALPAPAAWSEASGAPSGLPGSAHQQVSVTDQGYAIELGLDELWAQDADFPVVLDPALEWTDEQWTNGDGLILAFAPSGAEACDGGPCRLSGPIDGEVRIGNDRYDDPDMGEYLTYAAADLASLADRQISSAVLGGYEYSQTPRVKTVCDPIGEGSTGWDLAKAGCEGWEQVTDRGYSPGDEPNWFGWVTELTHRARAASAGTGPTGTVMGTVIYDAEAPRYPGMSLWTTRLRLIYTGYPVPRALSPEQTFGRTCWGGCASANQALAADPVDTATGALTEAFSDLRVAGVGTPINVARHYSSLNPSAGPLGAGWSFSYDASLTQTAAGELVFADEGGSRTRFGPLVGGGYAPLDPAVSASLSDGPDGTHVLRNLAGEQMTFDPEGRLTSHVDAQGQGLTFSYTGDHLTGVTDAVGQSVTVAWGQVSGEDRIISVTASDGRTVTYRHENVAGAVRLAAVTAVDGATTTYGYDQATGGLSSITDALGNISARNTYDPDTGRITSQLDETGARTTFSWDAATQTATVTDPTGRTRQDVYVGLNLVKQIDGNGVTSEILYDGDNNAAAAVDGADRLYREDHDDRDRLVRRVSPAPLQIAEEWTYDDQDHVTSYTDGDGFTTTYTYTDGLLTSQTNPDGGVETLTYTDGTGGTPAHLLASRTDPLGRTTTYGYNAVGDLVSTTTPAGRTTTMTYDQAHRLTSTTSPSGAVTSSTYDAAGRVLTTTDPLGAVTTNTYDDAGRLIRITAPDESWTTFAYDEADRPITTTTSAGATTATTYDDAGRVATTTDATGGVTTFGYDDAGRLLTTTDPTGRVTTNAYDKTGQLVSVTDPAGAAVTYAYDVLGRVTGVTDADGVVTTTNYDRRGNVTSTRNAADGGTTTYYDAMGRVAGQWDTDGVHTDYAYDLAGQVTEASRDRSTTNDMPGYTSDRTTYAYDADGLRTTVVDPRGNVPGASPAAYTTTTAYDAGGRPVSVTDALGNTTAVVYDDAGRVTSTTDAEGNTTTTAYDDMGRIAAVTSPDGYTTTYAYDQAGNLTAVTDPLGNATKHSYDDAGRRVSSTDPLERVTRFTYDAAGRLVTTVKPSGTATETTGDGTITQAYDDAGRLAGVDFSDDTPDLTYSYTTAGRLTVQSRADDGGGPSAIIYTYDSLGRRVAAERTGPAPSTAQYTYTSAGRLAGAAWSTGMSVAYSYDSAGQLTTVAPQWGTGTAPAVTYGYDPAGNTTSVRRAGASPTVTTSVYDAAGRLSALEHTAGTTTLASYALTRDGRGFPTRLEGTLRDQDTTPDTWSTLYEYNGSGWLTAECTMASTTGSTCVDPYQLNEYTYDAAGRRTGQATSDQNPDYPSEKWSGELSYAYDDAGQLTALSNDGEVYYTNTWTPDGALAQMTFTEGGGTTYRTDLAGEVTSIREEWGSADDPYAATTAYTYDPQDSRTSTSRDGVLTATWAWDDITGLPTRIGEHSLTNGDQLTSWLPDVTSSQGTVMAETGGFNGDRWLLTDPFANTAAWAATNGQGSAFGTRSYDAFGASSTFWHDWSTAFGYAGQYRDLLVDMRARDYNPETGQFTAADPVAQPVGMAYTSGYAYAFNNPLMHTDPTGLYPSDAADTWEFLKNEAVGVWNGAKAMASALVHPMDIYQGWVDSCNAGFDQWSGGNGPTLEGFLQCADNLNPFAGIRNGGAAAFNASTVEESGQLTGETLFNTFLVAAPFAKGVLRPRQAATTPTTTEGTPPPAGQIGPPTPVGQIGPGTCPGPAAVEAGAAAASSVRASTVRFSQSSVNGAAEIEASMQANGWVGDAIDVVRMPDGSLTSLDNTRLLAANRAGIDVQANIRGFNEALPSSLVGRFTTTKGGVPSTWGDAVMNRIGNQSAGYRKANPFGSWVTGWSGN